MARDKYMRVGSILFLVLDKIQKHQKGLFRAHTHTHTVYLHNSRVKMNNLYVRTILTFGSMRAHMYRDNSFFFFYRQEHSRRKYVNIYIHPCSGEHIVKNKSLETLKRGLRIIKRKGSLRFLQRINGEIYLFFREYYFSYRLQCLYIYI